MTDIENLSKEELIALLKLQKSSEKKKPLGYNFEGICKYTAGKGKTECTEEASTPYGFCKKHVRTVQAKKAKDEYDTAQSKLPVIKESVVKSETVTTEDVKEKTVKKSKITTPKEVKDIPKGKKEPKVTFNPKEVIHKKDIPKKDIPKKVSSKGKNSQKAVPKNTSKKIPAARSKTILPNFWGNYEDTETKIVFDPKTKEAIGVQEKGGSVSALKPEHVAICSRNGWNYILPYSAEESAEESDDESSGSAGGSDDSEDEESTESQSVDDESTEESVDDSEDKESPDSGEDEEDDSEESPESGEDESGESGESGEDEEVYGSSSS